MGVTGAGAIVTGIGAALDETGGIPTLARWGAIGSSTTAASTAHHTAQRVAALIFTFIRGRNRRAAQTNSAIAALCHRLFNRAAKAVPRIFISPPPLLNNFF